MTAPISWPSGVPSRVRLPFSGGPQDNRASFDPEIGSPIERQRTTIAPEVYDFVMESMTAVEFTTFRNWFKDTLKHGTKLFALQHPLTGGDGSWKIMRGNPPYQIDMEGNRVRLSFRAMLVRETPQAIPVNTVLPSISGSPYVGEILTANRGTWTGTGITYTYEWQVDGTIRGTGQTFVAEEGSVVVRVTATNRAGASTVASSAVAVTDIGSIDGIAADTVFTSSTIILPEGVA